MTTPLETERKTPVLLDRAVSPKAAFSPAAFLAGKDRLARLCIMAALASSVIAFLALVIAWSNLRHKVLFVMLDPSGNCIVAPGVTFLEAKDLHVQQALLAATALLLRNPKDFDQPEILQALFSRSAWQQATALKTAESAEFQERQIQQKPQIKRIDSISTRQDEIQVQVTGQVARLGIVQQAPYSEAIPFTLRLVFKPNLDLLRNRRQPSIVTQFTLHYEANHP